MPTTSGTFGPFLVTSKVVSFTLSDLLHVVTPVQNTPIKLLPLNPNHHVLAFHCRSASLNILLTSDAITNLLRFFSLFPIFSFSNKGPGQINLLDVPNNKEDCNAAGLQSTTIKTTESINKRTYTE